MRERSSIQGKKISNVLTGHTSVVQLMY